MKREVVNRTHSVESHAPQLLRSSTNFFEAAQICHAETEIPAKFSVDQSLRAPPVERKRELLVLVR